ncbi:hypothetical protein HDV02_005047 [Globomyces sp. JEL0801]|nr:hypothetical protein HDV02_005047 [Globomyces sp. JEL0801]
MTEPIENYELPKSVIDKIIRNALPEGVLVQKEAKMAVSKAATVFINYITAAAQDSISGTSRKSINASDVFKALEVLELDGSLLVPVQQAVKEYQAVAKEKRDEYRRRSKAKTGEDGEPQADQEHQNENEEYNEQENELFEGEDIQDDSIPAKRKPEDEILDDTDETKKIKPDEDTEMIVEPTVV